MKCAVGLCGHCQFGPLSLPGRPGVPHDRVAALLGAGALMPHGAQAEARRLEVRLVRRLPAHAARLRGRAAAVAGEVEIAYFLEATRGTVAGPTTSRWSRARSRRRTTPSASSRSGAHRARWSPSAPAPPPAASRRCATSRTSTSSSRSSTPRPPTSRRSRRRRRSPPTCRSISSCRGCPIDKRQLLEVISAFLPAQAAHPAHSVCIECKRRGNVCVMVAHGTPCLGPVTQAGCGAICPSYDRGCYGCFGPDGDAEHGLARGWCEGLGVDRTRAASASSAPSTPRRRRSGRRARPMSTPPDRPRTRTIRTDILARVEGEGAHVRAASGTATWRPSSCGSSSRRASSRRSCAAATSARRPTSRAHLRHLPGRLSDERRPRDRGRAAASRVDGPLRELRRLLYCGEWIESHALHVLHAARAGLPRLRERHRDGARPSRRRAARPRS